MLKNSRYKPLYKKFVRLRKNVQNRRKLLIGFNKKKWQSLITFLKILSKRRKKNFRSYDQSSFFLPRYVNSYKQNFLNKLLAKQRLTLFYGSLQSYKLKKIITSTKNKIKNNQIPLYNLFINRLENRLDTILYRSHFTKSIREARMLITHKHVYVNGNIINHGSFILEKGDVINLSDNVYKLAKLNVYSSNLWPLPPEYLQINYKTFQISILDIENKYYLSILFPFWLDLNTILNYYK